MNDNGPALTGEQMEEVLQVAMAPWDARSWDNLSEMYPHTADALAFAVRHGGLTAKGVRDYCDQWGYLPETANWLRQCVLHLHRVQAADEEAEEAAAEAPRRGRPIADEPGQGGRRVVDGLSAARVATSRHRLEEAADSRVAVGVGFINYLAPDNPAE
jgi:hypothetical protein